MAIARSTQRSPEAAAYRHLYKTARWRNLRSLHLAAYPMCAECERLGRIKGANTVHHIKAHKGDLALFYDPSNIESACKPCHDGPIQSQERTGYIKGVKADGAPIDPQHPWNVWERLRMGSTP